FCCVAKPCPFIVDTGILPLGKDFSLGLYLWFVKMQKKRLIRIELTQVAWKATVLPLNYRRSLVCPKVLHDSRFFFLGKSFFLMKLAYSVAAAFSSIEEILSK